jgi:GAF domain
VGAPYAYWGHEGIAAGPGKVKGMGQWLRGLPGRVADNVIASLIVVGILSAAFLGWVSGVFEEIVTGDASIPAWVLATGLVLVFALGAFTGFWVNRRREADPAAVAAHGFWQRAELHEEYAEHVSLTLDQLQNVISGGIPGVTLEQFIERGILHPGRDMIMGNQPRGADVRISILRPDGPDFVMAYSAGHTPEGHARFRMPIRESFSRLSYEQSRIALSSDVEADRRFTPHVRATRPYGSIVSVPLRSGGDTSGVFNVVFTESEGFDVADYTYIVLLAAIANVALAAAGSASPVRTAGPVQSALPPAAEEEQDGHE